MRPPVTPLGIYALFRIRGYTLPVSNAVQGRGYDGTKTHEREGAAAISQRRAVMVRIVWKRGRRVVLASYLAALILTQFLNYYFAPILPVLVAHYRISATAASWTVMIFPLLSILTSGLSGSMADRFGYRFCIRAGLLLITFFSCLRACGWGFEFLLLSQAGIAIGNPMVVTALPSLVGTWFAPTEEPSVTALCTVSLFTGIGLALVASPWTILVAGLYRAMFFLAGIAALCCALFFLAVPGKNPQPVPAVPKDRSWLSLFRERNVLILYAGSFLGQGCFNAITTWIAVIWHGRGFPLQAAGIASSSMVFAGILGSLLIPPLASRILHIRTALWLCLVPAMILVQPFLWSSNPDKAYIYGSVLGFFQLPSLAISLALLDQSVPGEHRGLACGLYWTIGNTGVLLLSYLVDWIQRLGGWRIAVDCITSLLALVIFLVAFLRPTPRIADSISLISRNR